MGQLILILLLIGLLDSTSIIPLCIVPLAAILGGQRPLAGAVSFLSGIFVVYTAAGALMLLGLDALFDAIGEGVSRWWKDPNTLELILQIIVGAVMVVFAWRLARARQSRADPSITGTISAPQGFVLGAGLTLAGLPGALPYFGAIDQILRADLGFAGSGAALLFYNIVFILPLVCLLFVRLLFAARSETIFGRVKAFADRWGRPVIVTVLLLIGAVLLADGIGWFVGYPLIPTGG